MSQQELVTCHCIISHPSKPKFLAIEHSDDWSPPLVWFPEEGSIVSKASLINHEIMNKYGLKTTVLRSVATGPKYQCLEVEMHSASKSKKLNAVWMGSKEYAQFRRSKPGDFDPFELWLKQKQTGKIPALRPPWERSGWFKSAVNWIHYQLDRLNIQTTGSVQQTRAFRTASNILSVPTARGKIFFKACYARPPKEAVLTQALAAKWPGMIPEPIVIDRNKNWMLMPDYTGPEYSQLKFAEYPAVARVLATIQLESLGSMDEWEKLSCPVQGLDYLLSFVQQLDRLEPILSDGGGIALTLDEIGQLKGLGEELQPVCTALSEFSIPLTLVHPDVWYSNLYLKNGEISIADWSGVIISHPFFSILKLLRFRYMWSEGQPALPSGAEQDSELVQAILEAYLEPFTRFETMDRLHEAMALTARLTTVWRLLKWNQDIFYDEPQTPAYHKRARLMQRIAREMIGPGAN